MKRLLIGLMALLVPVLGFGAGETEEIAARTRELRALLTPKLDREIKSEAAHNAGSGASSTNSSSADDRGRTMQNNQWRRDTPDSGGAREPFSAGPGVPAVTPLGGAPAHQVGAALTAIEGYCAALDGTREAEAAAIQSGRTDSASEIRARRVWQGTLMDQLADEVVKKGRSFVTRAQREDFTSIAAALKVATSAYRAEVSAGASPTNELIGRARELRLLLTAKVERDLRYETKRAAEVRWPVRDEADEMGRELQNRQWRMDNPGRRDEPDPYSPLPARYREEPAPDMPARDMQQALIDIEARCRSFEAMKRAEVVAEQNKAAGLLPGLHLELGNQRKLLEQRIAFVVKHGAKYSPWGKRGEFKRLTTALLSTIAAYGAELSPNATAEKK